MELKKEDKRDAKWGFICSSVGDCKVFHWSHRAKKGSKVSDITEGNIPATKQVRDPGGRLGPYSEEGKPDLRLGTLNSVGLFILSRRNFKVVWTPCDSRDLIIFTSRGVYDNMHPLFLGKGVGELNLPVESWEEAMRDGGYSAALSLWRNSLVEKMVFESGGSTSLLTKRYHYCYVKFGFPLNLYRLRLLAHCMEVTQNLRSYMETNPLSRPPSDHTTYPGNISLRNGIGAFFCLTFRL